MPSEFLMRSNTEKVHAGRHEKTCMPREVRKGIPEGIPFTCGRRSFKTATAILPIAQHSLSRKPFRISQSHEVQSIPAELTLIQSEIDTKYHIDSV